MSPRALPARPPQRWAVRVGALCLAALLAACGDGQEDGAPSSAAPDTTAERSTTTTIAEAQYDPASLPPCDPAQGYRTMSDWLPDSLPGELTVEHASTEVVGTAGFDRETVQTEVVLVEVDADGTVVADLHLRRHGLEGFEIEPRHMPGFGTQDDAGRLDEVRGHSGRVTREVNRGDGWGASTARWVEGGTGWTATSRLLDVPALAGALEPLQLSPGEEHDPSGRFTEVGRTPAAYHPGLRTTRIGLASPERAQMASPLEVSVRSASEGTTGLVDLEPFVMPPPYQLDATLAEVGGRVQLANGLFTSTTLADGSQVTVRAVTTKLPGAASELERQLTTEEVAALIDGLTRVEADDPRLPTVPLSPGWHQQPEADRLVGYCREAG